MSDTLLDTDILTVTACASCGVRFAMPEALMAKRRADGGNFFCPNGHSLAFKGSENERLREQAERLQRQLDNANSRATHLRDQRDAADRSNAALRGVVTRTKRRAAAVAATSEGRPG